MARWIERMRPIMAEMLGVKFCHYAIDPQTRKPTEDNVTMSVKSGRRALDMAGLEPTDVDLLVYGGNVMENLCPPTSTLIQEELKIPRAPNIRSTPTARDLQSVAAGLRSDPARRYKTALLMTSQLCSPFLRAEYFNPGSSPSRRSSSLFLCDGPARWSSRPIRTSGRNGSVSSGPTSSRWDSDSGRTCTAPSVAMHQSIGVYENGWHHVTQNFERACLTQRGPRQEGGDR